MKEGADDGRQADEIERLHGVLDVAHGARARAFKADTLHGLAEQFPVLGLFDGVGTRPYQLHPELFKGAVGLKIERRVQRRLAAHGWQQGAGSLGLDDPRHRFRVDGLDIGGVRHLRVGHYRGRVGVHQNDPVALALQRLAGLCAGIVELAGLADDYRSAPMIRMDLMSSRRGMAVSWLFPLRLLGFVHELDETLEQVARIMRSR